MREKMFDSLWSIEIFISGNVLYQISTLQASVSVIIRGMKRLSQIFASFALAIFAGCYSMDIATTDSLKGSALSKEDDKPLEHVVVSNYGWFLFNTVPLVCGNAAPGASFPWRFFSNHVTAELLHDRLMAHAAAIDANARDLVFIRNENVLFNMPIFNFQVPIPYLFTYKEVQFSAVLTKSNSHVQPDAIKKRKAVQEMNQLLNELNPEGSR